MGSTQQHMHLEEVCWASARLCGEGRRRSLAAVVLLFTLLLRGSDQDSSSKCSSGVPPLLLIVREEFLEEVEGMAAVLRTVIRPLPLQTLDLYSRGECLLRLRSTRSHMNIFDELLVLGRGPCRSLVGC